MFHELVLTSAHDMELHTDAPSTVGHGGYFQGAWFCEQWPDHFPLEKDEKMSMALQERLCLQLMNHC